MRLEYFQLIDRIVELDLDKRTIRAEARVPQTSTIFEGHFPGYPLMPGVLLLETMAQTSGWLIIGVTGFSRMPFLAAFKDAKLRSFVQPGDLLEIEATLTHKDAKRICNAEITFRVVEFPNPEFRAHMEKAAAAIAFPKQALTHG
jgi:3-hydroxyacyl-[acyl-carrier-protein] dehydratase